MNTNDEIPLEDHRYFLARLDHLETQNPAALLNYLEKGTLTEHLREVAARAMLAKANMVINRNVPEDQADELVMSQIVADSKEQTRLPDQASRMKLRALLDRYRAAMRNLPRTYQSESETTE